MACHTKANSRRRILHSLALMSCWAIGSGVQSAESPPAVPDQPIADQRPTEDPVPVESVQFERQEPFVVRPFNPMLEETWIGEGISYGPYRDGQEPGGAEMPNKDQIAEDLGIMAAHWQLLRVYGSAENAENILQLIHEGELPFRVLLGAWIANETIQGEQGEPARKNDAGIEGNRREIREAIRLANAYPDEVIAISVGNETQVFWSGHRTQSEVLIQYIREVRAGTKAPVTTADDFNFWNKPESKPVAEEVDFIVLHIHPMWAGLKLSGAVSWTKRIYSEICEHHPEKIVVIGETGWATQVHDEGEQAKMIKGKAGEEEQRLFYRQFTDWARERKICTFYFEAFDESWKGGSNPNEVEKHWGLLRVNREPKAALKKDGN